jgi:GMP synthase-like glutamine amidotransferase
MLATFCHCGLPPSIVLVLFRPVAGLQLQGVCFGHQLVGLELGGPVGRAGCWEVGARRVDVEPEAAAALGASGAAWAGLLPRQMCLLEFHQDQVRRCIPPRTVPHACVPPGWTPAGSHARQQAALTRRFTNVGLRALPQPVSGTPVLFTHAHEPPPHPPPQHTHTHTHSCRRHLRQVLAVPPGATLLASSERTPVEMFAVGDHVLCMQVRGCPCLPSYCLFNVTLTLTMKARNVWEFADWKRAGAGGRRKPSRLGAGCPP